MQYQLFLKELTENIKTPFAENGNLKVQTIHRSNSLKIKAVALYQGTSKLTPWIYMAPFYRLSREGVSFPTICRELENILGMCTLAGSLPDDIFLTFSSALPLLRFRLIAKTGNETLLKYVPHRDFCDIAIIYHLLIPCNGDHLGSAILYNDHCQLWGVTEDILYQAVMKQQEETEDFRIDKLSNIIRSCGETGYPDVGLYFMSNRLGYYGASAILNPRAVKEAAKVIGSSGYILPASIHEVLLISEKIAPPVENLRQLVREVNGTELMPEEILSDSIYYFDGEKGRVTEVK